MSSKKLVTLNQAQVVRNVANDKDIGRALFQEALDSGKFNKFLDDLKTASLGIIPPADARIHCLTIRVKQDIEWQKAINEGAPQTPKDFNVRKVGDLYPPMGKGFSKEEIILLNYPNGDGSWEKALAWAEDMGLEKTDPRQVFSIGKKFPNLHQTLFDGELMYVVATKECVFVGSRHACSVWWGGSDRKARLHWIGHFGGAGVWFVFRKPLKPQVLCP